MQHPSTNNGAAPDARTQSNAPRTPENSVRKRYTLKSWRMPAQSSEYPAAAKAEAPQKAASKQPVSSAAPVRRNSSDAHVRAANLRPAKQKRTHSWGKSAIYSNAHSAVTQFAATRGANTATRGATRAATRGANPARPAANTQLLAGAVAIHNRQKAWLRVACALATIVVFCTTYALILPAITASHTTYCGLEEHTHTDACYTTTASASDDDAAAATTCGLTEHTHTTTCFERPQAFNYTFDNGQVTGTVSVPYTDDLPLDLTCTVLTITSDDAAYEPLAAAAAQATQDAVQANVTSVTLYQTQFTSAGADYTLPAGTTPTITILTQNGAAITETTDAAGNTKATLATRTENTADPATSTDEGGEGTSSASEATDGEGSSSTAAEADAAAAATDGDAAATDTSAAADSTDPSAIVSEETNIMLLSLSEDDAGQITATDTQTAASIQLLSDTNTTAVVTYKEIITEFYKRVDTLAELAQYNDSSDKRYIIVFDNDSRMLVGNQETWDNSGGVDYYTIPVCVSPISDQSGETGYYTVLDLDTNSNVSAPISDPENGAYAKAHYAIDYPPKDTSKDYVFMHFAGLDLTSDKDWTQVLWLGTSGLFNYSTEFTFVEPTEDFGSWKAYVSASGIRYLACSNTDSVQPTTTDVDLEVDSEGNASSSSTYDSSHKSDYDSHVLSQYEVHSETDSSRTSEMGFKIYIYKGGSANYTLEIEYYDSAAEADKVQKIILTERIPEDQLPTDSTPSETHSSITGSTLISGTGEGSDATSLSNQLSGSTLTYASDATTSNIESEFSTSYNEETIKMTAAF